VKKSLPKEAPQPGKFRLSANEAEAKADQTGADTETTAAEDAASATEANPAAPAEGA
jgi:hypothetical protein